MEGCVVSSDVSGESRSITGKRGNMSARRKL